MRKWEINCDGWYPYCPVCKQETKYMGPVCTCCGTILEPNERDTERMHKEDPALYEVVMNYVKTRRY